MGSDSTGTVTAVSRGEDTALEEPAASVPGGADCVAVVCPVVLSCRCGVAHEVRVISVASNAAVRQTCGFVAIRLRAITKGYPMFWVFLELALGLALFVFLVWWTLPKKDKGDPPE